MSEKKVLGNYKYTVNGNVVEVWHLDADEDAAPYIHQPFNPEGGRPWNAEEAEQWIIDYINTH